MRWARDRPTRSSFQTTKTSPRADIGAGFCQPRWCRDASRRRITKNPLTTRLMQSIFLQGHRLIRRGHPRITDQHTIPPDILLPHCCKTHPMCRFATHIFAGRVLRHQKPHCLRPRKAPGHRIKIEGFCNAISRGSDYPRKNPPTQAVGSVNAIISANGQYSPL